MTDPENLAADVRQTIYQVVTQVTLIECRTRGLARQLQEDREELQRLKAKLVALIPPADPHTQN